MRTGISFTVSTANRKRLEAIISGRNTPQKHVWRARIVLMSADGVGTHGVMAATIARQGIRRMPERGKGEDNGLALAGTFLGGRGFGPSDRQDTAAGQGACPGGQGGRTRAPYAATAAA